MTPSALDRAKALCDGLSLPGSVREVERIAAAIEAAFKAGAEEERAACAKLVDEKGYTGTAELIRRRASEGGSAVPRECVCGHPEHKHDSDTVCVYGECECLAFRASEGGDHG